ncbi:MAG TPA: ABC transporter ATP-binding protein, partial [Ochrobactrum intermedium]
MAFLNIKNLKKSFGANTVVHDFNLAVEKGEFVSFLGPSGCGKTTVLRMIAGFEMPDSGAIEINGKDVVDLKPNQRNIGMVFQAYALFPNMTVAQNVSFGLRVAGKPKAEIDATVKEMLGLIRLDHLADRYPYQMSGGQQQRVALARALVFEPSVVL